MNILDHKTLRILLDYICIALLDTTQIFNNSFTFSRTFEDHIVQHFLIRL
jgi:hypothetical protein